MTGLEKTLESLENTKEILTNSLYKETDETYKLSYNGAMQIAIIALKNEIEMVEFRVKQEKSMSYEK